MHGYQCVVHPVIQMNTMQKGSWKLIITSSPVRSHYCSVTIYSDTITFKANPPSFRNQKEFPNALYCPHCAAMIRSQLVQYHSQIHGVFIASWFYSLAKWIDVSFFFQAKWTLKKVFLHTKRRNKLVELTGSIVTLAEDTHITWAKILTLRQNSPFSKTGRRQVIKVH